MVDSTSRIRVLEEQTIAATDTHKNLVGLVEKLARIQGVLMESGFDTYSDEIGGPFSHLSTAAEQIQTLLHEMEHERNALRE